MDALTLLAAVTGFSLLGTFLGAASGLVPGLHINNLAYILGASTGALSGAALGLSRPATRTRPFFSSGRCWSHA